MLICMRTTIDIENNLLALAKRRALETGSSLKSVIESALRQALLRSEQKKTKFHLKWKTVCGNLIPGVDITDRDSLYERMDGRG